MTEEKEKIVKVSTNFRITIPREFRKEMGLKMGDRVIFLLNNNEALVVPAMVVPKVDEK